jgi:competence protein ComER
VVVGFIGTGSMGATLIHAFVRSNALKPEAIIIHNRTTKKADELAAQYPGMRVSCSLIETAVSSDILFICVKPFEYKNVLDKIQMFMRREQILISITSPVFIRQLEKTVSCKIAKVIPSLTNYECSGATLCMYGERLTDKDKELIETLLCHISTPIRIQEQLVRVSSDISSIGPAFIAFFIAQLVEAAVEETGINHAEASRLASEMVLGTGLLLTSGGFTAASLQERISVPGGITAKALHAMRQETEGLFGRVIRTTHAKFEEDVAMVDVMMSD